MTLSFAGYLNDQEALSQSDSLFLETARLIETATGRPRLEIVQARLIQVFYLLMTCRMNEAWYTFGSVLQLVSALGLHRPRISNRTARPDDYVKIQCSKRTFWTAYILDKYIGVTMGRPNHFHDDDIQIDYPDCVNDHAMTATGSKDEPDNDCEIDAFVFNARLARIVGKASRLLYGSCGSDRNQLRSIITLNAEIDKWHANLPPFLSSVKPSSLVRTFRRQQIALRVAHCHCRLHVNRVSLLRNFRNNGDTSTQRYSAQLCITAAAQVLKIVDEMARDGHLFHAFWWTHYVAFCALSAFYIWDVQGNKATALDLDAQHLQELAERCHTHLANATATNSPSRRYSIILEELRAEAVQRRRSDTVTTAIAREHETPTSKSPASHEEQVMSTGEPALGSPALHNFLESWQPSDWLDLDAYVSSSSDTTGSSTSRLTAC